jgi:hypothetical protein
VWWRRWYENERGKHDNFFGIDYFISINDPSAIGQFPQQLPRFSTYTNLHFSVNFPNNWKSMDLQIKADFAHIRELRQKSNEIRKEFSRTLSKCSFTAA